MKTNDIASSGHTPVSLADVTRNTDKLYDFLGRAGKGETFLIKPYGVKNIENPAPILLRGSKPKDSKVRRVDVKDLRQGGFFSNGISVKNLRPIFCQMVACPNNERQHRRKIILGKRSAVIEAYFGA